MVDAAIRPYISEQGKPYNFFVIDDSKFMIKSLSDIIRNNSGNVIGTAEDGFDALEKLKQLSDQVDIITLDITMPKLDGVSLLPMIKGITPQVKVVIISAMGKIETIKQLVKMGADYFIIKPFSEDNVNRILDFVLHQKKKINSGQRKILNNNSEVVSIFAVEKDENSSKSLHTIIDWFGCKIVGVTYEYGLPLYSRLEKEKDLLDVVIISIEQQSEIEAIVAKIQTFNKEIYIILLSEKLDASWLDEFLKLDVNKRILIGSEKNLYELLVGIYPVNNI